MAKNVTYCCDRCGKVFAKNGFTRFLYSPRKITSFWWQDSNCINETEFDLCNECSSAFYDFMCNREVMPNGK